MLAGYSNSGRTLLPPTPCPARRPDERHVVGDTDLNTLLLAALGRRSAMSGRCVASFQPACAIVVSSAFVITRDTHPITMPRPPRGGNGRSRRLGGRGTANSTSPRLGGSLFAACSQPAPHPLPHVCDQVVF